MGTAGGRKQFTESDKKVDYSWKTTGEEGVFCFPVGMVVIKRE